MGGPGFAVVEFDTTGLMAADTDRATRITILLLDVHGHIERQWSSPLTVSDHPSPSPADPEFAQVAPTVVSLVAGRVLVAHGATFHLGFLAHELERVSLTLPAAAVALCTLQLAHDIAPRVSRSAAACAAELGARPGDASAPPPPGAGDATATAALLATLIGLDDESPFWDDHLQRAHAALWPVPSRAHEPVSVAPTSVEPLPVALTATPPAAEAGRGSEPSGFLAGLVPHLPVALGPAEHHDYLALIDLCLLRGWFAERDSRSLVRLAERLNISRFVCETLHLEYFAALCELAQHDAGALTDTRIARLWAVGDLLDLPMSAIIEALGQLHEKKSRQLLAG